MSNRHGQPGGRWAFGPEQALGGGLVVVVVGAWVVTVVVGACVVTVVVGAVVAVVVGASVVLVDEAPGAVDVVDDESDVSPRKPAATDS